MKRWISILLFLLFLAGCAPVENAEDVPSVDVYYLAPSEGYDSGSAVGRVTYTAAHREDLLHEALVRLAEEPEEKEIKENQHYQGTKDYQK